MRIGFSARAWMLSAATGLVILPSMDVESQAELQLTGSPVASSSGEPRKLIERPATRAAIDTSRPARSFFPNLFPGRKPSPKPTLSVEQNPVLPSVDVSAPPINDGKSEVQRHLEELYRREGREAPSLDLGEFPSAGLSQSIPPLPNRDASPESNNGPIQHVAVNPIKRFFQKITPFRRSKDPNDERPAHVEPLPASARQEQLRLQQTPIAPPVTRPTPILLSEPGLIARPAVSDLKLLIPPPPAPADSSTGTSTASAGEEKSGEPVLSVPTAPAVAGDTDSDTGNSNVAGASLPEFLPAVELPRGSEAIRISKELSDAPIGTEVNEKSIEAVVPGSDEFLSNPFPELSESAADAEFKAPIIPPAPLAEKKKESAADDNPFTGLKLNAAAVEPASSDDSAVKQTAADSVAFPKLPDLPAPVELATPDDAAPAGELPEISPAEKPTTKTAASGGEHLDKLQRIAERSELTGLKGFCPVALRDSRELKDARPQFQAAFNGKIYNLSSSEARAKFESDPKAYAPAAAGQDVVLAAGESTDQEGSLDHAVWYRNRLYLFSSKESREEFVASPSKFSVDIPELK